MISTADLTFQFHSKKPEAQIPQKISNISFTEQRVPARKPQRARATARISAFYAPPLETKETLYELLGIGESGSSFSDIKKAYKQMARKYHPDVSPPERVDEYTRRFIMVHEAYETLSNPQTRALYDRDLAVGSNFSFSPRRPRHQGSDETEDWKMRWQSQLDELQRRDCRGRTTWGARMRNSTN
ncbi:DNAJ-like 20 [Perilla frutescens var. hirtella]|uniref:DNAJ-like 20 n=1 Tax=Perilla frutescens var. hirtella TaxID=608512 RepID=A0AAD4J0X8_PERFH|nr:DNAJ-like 20 [Perilla frutescens var. frutescens]KAH6824613.1 DNAJ-like 20 [Perilla frutescens var. hirtella]